MENKITVIASGWLMQEEGVRNIESVLLEMMEATRDRLYIAVYTVSSKPAVFWEKLESLLERGVDVRFVIQGNIDHDPGVYRILEDLLVKFPDFCVYLFTGDGPLHAKIAVSDGIRAVTGSANITGGGLFSNHEIGVYIEGEAAWTLEKLIRKITGSNSVRIFVP